MFVVEGSDRENRGDRGRGEGFEEGRATGEARKLDEISRGHDDGARELEKVEGGLCGAASGEEVVHNDDALAGCDETLLELERVPAVLKAVVDGEDLAGDLAGLADHDERLLDALRDEDAKDESPRLHASNGVDSVRVHAAGADGLDDCVRRTREQLGVGEEGPDVAKDDSGLGIVGVGAKRCLELLLEFVEGHDAWKSEGCGVIWSVSCSAD